MIRLYSRCALLYCLLLLAAACNRRHHVVNRSFYYWKTGFSLHSYECSRLRDLQCRTIYLRCFDVDWDEKQQTPKPVATVHVQEAPDKTFAYVPVVFITQKAIARITPQDIPQLAAHICQLTDQLLRSNQLSFKELQIDCDWTATSRDHYFALLTALRQQPLLQHKTLSCTIRLHQVKYRLRSGVPPVDRGLLMCYNLGDLRMPGTRNSILNAQLAKDYLSGAGSYPLPLDVALPLFRWCVQFRDGKMKGILRDVPPETLVQQSLFRQQQQNVYTCLADTVWEGYHFQTGDEVRIEAPAIKDIQEVATFTARQIRNDTLSVILFHADSVTLSKYSHDEIEAIYNAYH